MRKDHGPFTRRQKLAIVLPMALYVAVFLGALSVVWTTAGPDRDSSLEYLPAFSWTFPASFLALLWPDGEAPDAVLYLAGTLNTILVGLAALYFVVEWRRSIPADQSAESD